MVSARWQAARDPGLLERLKPARELELKRPGGAVAEEPPSPLSTLGDNVSTSSDGGSLLSGQGRARQRALHVKRAVERAREESKQRRAEAERTEAESADKPRAQAKTGEDTPRSSARESSAREPSPTMASTEATAEANSPSEAQRFMRSSSPRRSCSPRRSSSPHRLSASSSRAVPLTPAEEIHVVRFLLLERSFFWLSSCVNGKAAVSMGEKAGT